MHFVDISIFEKLGNRNSSIHRLDPRAKLIVIGCYIFTVMTFPKYDFSALLPFLIFPIYLIITADLPVVFLAKRLLLMSTFAVMVGIWNPFLDKHMFSVCGITVGAGWFSFASILLRFCLTAGCALILVATTGMMPLCQGMQRLGVPRVFVMQILFLYRYIFVIGDEAGRLLFARNARCYSQKGKEIRVYMKLIYNLLNRSLDRAERIYIAMKSRGFDGTVRCNDTLRWRWQDTLFLTSWVTCFAFMRCYNIANLIGKVLT